MNNLLYGKRKEIILFLIVFGIAGLFVFVSVIYGENFHLCINDNLDSNIPIFKMIRDNNIFWNQEKEIPFLHGDITRGEYHIGLSLEAWIYMVFPPFIAYVVTRLLAYLISVLGFFLIAKTASRLFNLFCVVLFMDCLVLGHMRRWDLHQFRCGLLVFFPFTAHIIISCYYFSHFL